MENAYSCSASIPSASPGRMSPKWTEDMEVCLTRALHEDTDLLENLDYFYNFFPLLSNELDVEKARETLE